MQAAEQLEIIHSTNDVRALDEVRVHLLGKKGVLTEALKSVSSLSPDERKTKGKELNILKGQLNAAIEQRKKELELQAESEKLAHEAVDISLGTTPYYKGKRHPISQVMQEIQDIFASMGFEIRTGPLIEDDNHNFTALNIPAHHPARQMHDTFYVEAANSADKEYVLRTHTSPVQVRTMRTEEPPIRIIAPGSTFRSDSDITHTPMFHQVEGLYIDKNITMAHLKGCVSQFLRLFFGRPDLEIRFRPSFFPFTEPSAEIDIGCTRTKNSIELGGHQDWLEVMGCGMVHRNVLKHCDLDADIYQGFAFGMGVERLAMLKYNIPDLRTFFDSEAQWLSHYGF